MKHFALLSTVLACVALLGCTSDDKDNLGKSEKLGASLSDYAGNWSGYAEAFAFDDATDTVRLSLDEDGNGVLRFGDAVKLPAPDPDYGYPPSSHDPFVGHVVSTGFSYAVTGAKVESRRIRLATTTDALYRAWCSLMEPVPDSASTVQPAYACIAAEDFGMMTTDCKEGDNPVDCGKLSCRSICTCDEDACQVVATEDDIKLDGVLEEQGEELQGTLVLQGQRITVRMTRD